MVTLKATILKATKSVKAKKPSFKYNCEICGGKFESFEKLPSTVKRICDECEDDESHTASTLSVKKVTSTSEAVALAQGTSWDLAQASNAHEYIQQHKALYFLMDGERAVACGYLEEGNLKAFDTQDVPLEGDLLTTFTSLLK